MAEIRDRTPDGRETIKDRIVLYVMGLFGNVTFLEEDQAVVDADPNDKTVPRLFDIVKRGTLEDIDANETPGCAIEEGDEDTEQLLYPYTDKRFRLFVNFKVIKSHGVDVYSLLNYYSGRVEQTLVRPEEDGLHLADLAIDVETAGNTIQYNGDSDPEPGMTAIFSIQYRHRLGNPSMEA